MNACLLVGDEISDLPASAPGIPREPIAHFEYVGSTLVLEDETRLRIYFKTDVPATLVANYRVGDGGDATLLTIRQGTGGFSKYHYIEVPNIFAWQLDRIYDFEFTNAGGETAYVKHCPYAYVRWAIDLAGEDDNTINLRYVAGALYRYGESAKVYFETR